ncbi:Uncharacterised protein [Slackia heliotrinireducens]|uniref:Uncharacterized protein n=1 Tax=Slackia heliotrinireducens (strain ATCC 29202 / DSM 20476 / NCTC 11029 / RHS 1) TaxID=471855 RepID=C7N7J8_SLAHD|nr:hypothetical protein [Slackia heliotrinireducens]ACV22883.1 hypothetical protein Shel_18670 [Slackia heliotrinireducens DSM 20476]VEH01660.1 Uncharacterised protein [Slackia heliotrinireducens]
MRGILLSICPAAIWAIVVCELIVAALLFIQWNKTKQMLALLTFLVSAGLILDAVIIGLGSLMQPEVLKAISSVRFVAHGMLIPLLFPICGYALDFKKPALRAIWILAAVLMVAGVAQAFSTVLEPKEIAGVVRFVSSADTPNWADTVSKILSFGTVIPMMIAGVAVWIRQKTPHLFLSGFLMFVFSALGPATGNADLIFFISMFGELFMVLFLYMYAKKERS